MRAVPRNPTSDCTVRSMSSSRAWVSTWMVTPCGHEVLLDERAHEVEVGLARGGEPDLDLAVAHLHEELEHPQLALRVHRLDEGLVAVAQVDAAPRRRAVITRSGQVRSARSTGGKGE